MKSKNNCKKINMVKNSIKLTNKKQENKITKMNNIIKKTIIVKAKIEVRIKTK